MLLFTTLCHFVVLYCKQEIKNFNNRYRIPLNNTKQINNDKIKERTTWLSVIKSALMNVSLDINIGVLCSELWSYSLAP